MGSSDFCFDRAEIAIENRCGSSRARLFARCYLVAFLMAFSIFLFSGMPNARARS